MTYRLLDLFSGIGGFSLGLERSGGFKTVAFCEIEDFPRKVLKKHWPEVPIYDDVRTLTAERLAADGIGVDAICGGFPCQDISTAGRGAGIAEGTRSGLWSEYARIVGELRPRYVIVENVAALLGRGLDRVLGDLASLGYDAEWHCIPAAAVGAPHRRDRLWIVAHPSFMQRDGGNDHPAKFMGGEQISQPRDGRGPQAMAYAICERQPRQGQPLVARHPAPIVQRQTGDAFDGRIRSLWSAEPDVGRVADGVPARVDRLKGLGNAVVPQIPELIGRAILESEKVKA